MKRNRKVYDIENGYDPNPSRNNPKYKKDGAHFYDADECPIEWK